MILTLALDPASQAHFAVLRRRHFPPERNVIDAHVTLFHQLPESIEIEAVIALAADSQQPFPLQITGLRSLGRGVAYRLASPVLDRLHERLASDFAADLIAQDRQRFQAHVVVQNKVDPPVARSLLAELSAAFVPGVAMATGMDLWAYLGGPWRHTRTFPFREGATAAIT